jgi:hypothetical protein
METNCTKGGQPAGGFLYNQGITSVRYKRGENDQTCRHPGRQNGERTNNKMGVVFAYKKMGEYPKKTDTM